MIFVSELLKILMEETKDVSALNSTSTLDIVMSERYVHCRWVRHGANGGEAPLVVLLIPQPLSCQSIMWKGRMAQIGGK